MFFNNEKLRGAGETVPMSEEEIKELKEGQSSRGLSVDEIYMMLTVYIIFILTIR